MQDARCQMQDARCKDTGYRIQDTGYRIQDAINLKSLALDKFVPLERLVNKIFEVKDARFNQDCILHLVSGIRHPASDILHELL